MSQLNVPASQPLWQQQLNPRQRQMLAEAAVLYGLRPELGEIVVLGERPYVTFPGLVRLAKAQGMFGCPTRILREDWEQKIFVAKAYVYLSEAAAKLRCAVEAHGTATPDNVKNKQMLPYMLELAETRARNRAIRASYAIDLVSYEEIPEGTLAFVHGEQGELPSSHAQGQGTSAAGGAPTASMPSARTTMPQESPAAGGAQSDSGPSGPPPPGAEDKRRQALACYQALGRQCPQAQISSIELEQAEQLSYGVLRQRYVKARETALKAGVKLDDIRALEHRALGPEDGIPPSAASGS